MNLLDYISQKEIEAWTKRIGRGFSTSLAVMDFERKIVNQTEDFPDNFSFPNIQDDRTSNFRSDDGLYIRELEINNQLVGTIVGCNGKSGAKKDITDAVDLLYDIIINRLTSEAELESLSSELAANYEEINIFFENNDLMANVLDIDKVCEITLDQAQKVSGATKLSIMLLDNTKKNLLLKRAKGVPEGKVLDIGIEIKGSMWEEMARSGNYLLIEDVRKSPEFRQSAKGRYDIDSFATNSFLSLPLIVRESMIGVLNVGDKDNGTQFNSINSKYLAVLTALTAIAIENTRLYNKIARETKKRTNLQRYLSSYIVDELLNTNQELKLGGEKQECSILFTDICGFTAIAERLKPEEIVNMLNEYFSMLTEIIFANKGTLDKYIGDSVMAIFGAPFPSDQSTFDAVSTALLIQEKCLHLKEKWEEQGRPGFVTRIGIHTGEVIAGNVGSLERMDYTVIGDTVNLASRLEANARPGKILISSSTYERVKNLVRVKHMNPISVKGKSEPVEICEVECFIETYNPKEVKVQRRYLRIEVFFHTLYHDESREVFQKGIIQSISVGGLALTTNSKYEISQNLTMNLELPNKIKVEHIIGRVVRERHLRGESAKGLYQLGIEFIKISQDDQEKIRQFICTHSDSE